MLDTATAELSETRGSTLPEHIEIVPDQGDGMHLRVMRHRSGALTLSTYAIGMSSVTHVSVDTARRYAAAIVAQCDALEASHHVELSSEAVPA